MSTHSVKKKTYRLDGHMQPPFTTDHVALHFFKHTDGIYTVTQTSKWLRTAQGAGHDKIEFDLVNPHADGNGNKIDEPFLLSVSMNGAPLSPDSGIYTYDGETGKLTIALDPDENTVDFIFQTRIDPANNAKMEGLYRTGGVDMTQFEANGFVNMTPFPEYRTDIQPTFRVVADAPANENPELLSNGNLVGFMPLGNGYHRAVYDNPVPIPNYIAAFVAGDLDKHEGTFVTRSGRAIRIPLYTEEKGMAKNGYAAIDAVKKLLKFDEDEFDVEYDEELDNFKVLAVSKFKYGAMENKGFEISQDNLVMLHPETSTYNDMYAVYSVVGHEVAHNRSGNRTVILTFMYISLKEGLTTLREQMFMESICNPLTERINQAQILRKKQFSKDDTPLARPILPDEVDIIEMCYDGVAYEKSAEIKRMMATMTGWDAFKKGVSHYFKKHDLQPTTMRDFVTCIEEKSGMDFSGHFFEWYKQSGHPHVRAKGVYDADAKTYTLTLEQKTPPTPDQPIKRPMFIPVKMALVDKWGEDIPAALDSSINREMPSEHILNFTEERQSFTFIGVETEPAYHSIFRDFSAPVSLDEPGLTDTQLYTQMRTDPSNYNRWEAAQTLYLKEMKRLYSKWDSKTPPAIDSRLTDALRDFIRNPNADPMFVSQILTLPDTSELEAALEKPIRADFVALACSHLKKEIGKSLYDDMGATLDRIHDGAAREHKFYDYKLHGISNLKCALLFYMIAGNPAAGMEKAALTGSSGDRMDRMMALQALRPFEGRERDILIQDYFNRYASMDMEFRKWMALVASEDSDKVFEKVEKITQLPNFDRRNAKHSYILYSNLTANYAQFHRPDGNGYQTLADGIIRMEKIKVGGDIAARLLQSMANWRDYDAPNSALMLGQLRRIKEQPGLSDSVQSTLRALLPKEKGNGAEYSPGLTHG